MSPPIWPARARDRASSLSQAADGLLTVLTQTPPFMGLTTDAGSVGDVLEALMQSDGADVGVAPGCQRWLGPRLD